MSKLNLNLFIFPNKMHFNNNEQNQLVKLYGTEKGHQIIESFNRVARIFSFDGLAEDEGYCVDFGEHINAHFHIRYGIGRINIAFPQEFDQDTIELLDQTDDNARLNPDGSLDDEILERVVASTPVKAFIESFPIGYSVSVWKWMKEAHEIMYHIEFGNHKLANFLLKRLAKKLVMHFGITNIGYGRTFEGAIVGEN